MRPSLLRERCGFFLLAICNGLTRFFGPRHVILQNFQARLSVKYSWQLEEGLYQRERQRKSCGSEPPSPRGSLSSLAIWTRFPRDLLHYACGLQCHSGMELHQHGPHLLTPFAVPGKGLHRAGKFPSEEACNCRSTAAPRAPASIYCKPAKVNQPAAFCFG